MPHFCLESDEVSPSVTCIPKLVTISEPVLLCRSMLGTLKYWKGAQGALHIYWSPCGYFSHCRTTVAKAFCHDCNRDSCNGRLLSLQSPPPLHTLSAISLIAVRMMSSLMAPCKLQATIGTSSNIKSQCSDTCVNRQQQPAQMSLTA